MAEVPIVIPLIIAGVFLGSAWPNKSLAGSWRRAILAGATSGLLNAGYAFALGLLGKTGSSLSQSQQQALPAGLTLPSTTTSNSLSSILVCALTGFVVVMLVYVSAIAMIRYRRGRTLEPEESE